MLAALTEDHSSRRGGRKGCVDGRDGRAEDDLVTGPMRRTSRARRAAARPSARTGWPRDVRRFVPSGSISESRPAWLERRGRARRRSWRRRWRSRARTEPRGRAACAGRRCRSAEVDGRQAARRQLRAHAAVSDSISPSGADGGACSDGVAVVRDHDDRRALGVQLGQQLEDLWPVRVSRLPVGSSANTIAAAPSSARAIATRWRSPPESSAGGWLSRRRGPTRSSASRRPSASSRRGTPA